MLELIEASSAHRDCVMRCVVQSALNRGGATVASLHSASMRQPILEAAALPVAQTALSLSLLRELPQLAAEHACTSSASSTAQGPQAPRMVHAGSSTKGGRL